MLEHPEASAAWGAFGINRPQRGGGWVPAGLFARGWTCCVEQGHYGHRARKATWLYACDVELPELKWGPSAARDRLDAGYHSAEERAAARARGEATARDAGRLTDLERLATPLPFCELLLSIARTAPRQEVA